jgi:D-xylose transport system substrate-binding protein
VAGVTAAGLLVLSACGNSGGGGSSASGGSSGSSADAGRACVILPDADSSSRWENGDRPALEKSFKDAGYTPDIQNAQNDTSKFATIADQQLTKGCKLMVLVNLNGAAEQVTQKAHAQGITVIAYDRPIDGADYYISFDNFHVGELEGQMLVDALKAGGKDVATAKIVYLGGDPTDGNAKQFHDGADKVLKGAGLPKPAFEAQGTWDATKAGTYFEQAYTALSGNVDAVWAANDVNANAAIQVLDKNGKKVPVSGQDATPVGLQNVLLGKQAATVYKPYQLEAQAVIDLATKLKNGEKPTVDKKDTFGVPFIAETPVVVTTDNMQQVFDDGNAKISDVCTGEVAPLCQKYNLK